MIEKEIIKDQKETIHRLQDECAEKTKIILKLHQENERLKRKKEITSEVAKDNSIFEDWYYELKGENEQFKKALEEIREKFKSGLKNVSEICIKTTPMYAEKQDIIIKINEVLK